MTLLFSEDQVKILTFILIFYSTVIYFVYFDSHYFFYKLSLIHNVHEILYIEICFFGIPFSVLSNNFRFSEIVFPPLNLSFKNHNFHM